MVNNDMTFEKGEYKFKKILDKIEYKYFSIISFVLLSIWILSPLLVMFSNLFNPKNYSLILLYKVLQIIGYFGLFLGFIYMLKNIFKDDNYKNKLDYKKYLPILILILLLLWCYITCFGSINISRSIWGTFYRKDGFMSYLYYFGILLLGMMLKGEDKKNIVDELIIIEIIIATFNLFNNDLTNSLLYNQKHYIGIFSNTNHYGYYLMFGIIPSIILFLNEKKKLKYFLSYIILLYILVLNDTFGCFLAVFCTIVIITIYYIKYHKKEIKKLIPIILAIIIICINNERYGQNIFLNNINLILLDSHQIKEAIKEKDIEKINKIGTTRGVLWRYGLKASIEKPIIGYGIENIESYYRVNGVPKDRPHNMLIQFLVFTGIPGMLLYILFIFTIFKRSIFRIKELKEIDLLALFMVICYFESSLVGNSMFYTSPYYFIFLGILIPNLFYNRKTMN